MQTKLKKILIIIFLCAFTSCDRPSKDSVAYVKFTNNSQKTIVLYYSNNYPDTTLNEIFGCCEILSHNNCNCLNSYGWNYANKFNVLLFFIWDKDTVNKYGFDNCNDRILNKYKYSVEELENMGWTITYP